MLALNELITSVRFRLKDMHGTLVSDYELSDGINKAIKLLYTHMGRNFIYTAAKKTPIIVDDGEPSRLPLDFHAVKKVKTEDGATCLPTPTTARRPFEYRIIGDYFEAIDGTYILEYYYVPSTQNMSNGQFDIPERILPFLTELTVAVLSGAMETAESVAAACCQVLSAGNISHFDDFGPVQVWGGRA